MVAAPPRRVASLNALRACCVTVSMQFEADLGGSFRPIEHIAVVTAPGNGNDVSAQVTGHISAAVGSEILSDKTTALQIPVDRIGLCRLRDGRR
jgi:hypothetical protein